MADLTPALPAQASPPAFAISSAMQDALADVDVVALPVLPGSADSGLVLGPGAEELEAALGTDLLAVLEVDGAKGEAGQVTALPVPTGTEANADLRLVLLVGLGEQRAADFRKAGAALARATRDRAAVATTIPVLDPGTGLEPFVTAAVLASFAFHIRSREPEFQPVGRVVLAGLAEADADALDRATAVADAAWRSRQLATIPSNFKNPPWLADHALAVGEAAGLKVRIWDEKQLAEEGFGGIVGVGAASATPPRLIRLDYSPPRAGRRTPTIALVGKGITFDTGGLSIKPGESMVNMKRDMTGGAVVLATMAALAAVNCPVKVVGLIAAAENAIDGSALRPGDVLRHFGGRTSEVTNTDAEGRLVMADALAYAVSEVKPAALVDVATLTGAMKVALGQQVGGLFSTDDALAQALLEAGQDVGEPLWRFPLAAAYEDKLASKIADADNAGGGPGAITAALFLRHFTGDLPWAHLDIASVGDAPADRDEWTPGPTGWGVRTLLRWLGGTDPLAGVGGDS